MYHRSLYYIQTNKQNQQIATTMTKHSSTNGVITTTPIYYQFLKHIGTTLLILALITKVVFTMFLVVLPSLRVQSFDIQLPVQPIVSQRHHIFKNTVRNIPHQTWFARTNRHIDITSIGSRSKLVLHSTIINDEYFTTKGTTDQHQDTIPTAASDNAMKNFSMTTQLLFQQTAKKKLNTEVHDKKQKASSFPEKVKHEMTYYEILGTTSNATKEEIKRQYLIMAKRTHPDAKRSQQYQCDSSDLCTALDFSDITTAYHTLSDPIERKKYDRTLHSTEMMQIILLLGDICLGTTLTVTEITSTIVAMAIILLLQPIAIHVTTELFYLSIDNDK